jgi:hypothetical protein
MPDLTLAQAQTIIATALGMGPSRGCSLLPLPGCARRAEGVRSTGRHQPAPLRDRPGQGAWRAVVGYRVARALAKRAAASPHFIAAVTHAVGGSLVPVPGGVLVRGADRTIIGAVDISGDNSDNDEAAAIAGIETVGLIADPGEG